MNSEVANFFSIAFGDHLKFFPKSNDPNQLTTAELLDFFPRNNLILKNLENFNFSMAIFRPESIGLDPILDYEKIFAMSCLLYHNWEYDFHKSKLVNDVREQLINYMNRKSPLI